MTCWVLISEIEQIRAELQQVKMTRGNQTGSLPRGGVLEPGEFFSHHPRVSQQTENRVKKLTKFFGDEPPLLRLFLKNLGYEKYAALFEEAKIGMLELPYLSEDRLEKLGIPMGPRMRILQESRASLQPQMAPQHLPTNNTLPSLVNTTAATTATDRK